MAEIKITFDAADDYERFMGRWSRAVGERFLAWFNPAKGVSWLDVGCGTGAFSELIVTRCAPASTAGLDPSSEQMDYVRELLPGHRFEVADATAMPFDDHSFDVVASALVLHFIPDRVKAFAEMKRVLPPGGLVGGYTWKRTENSDFAAYVPILRAAERVGGVALRSGIVPEGSVDGMRGSLQAAGFTDAEAVEIEVTQTYKSFDEYWEAQTLPFSPSGKTVATLDDAQRAKAICCGKRSWQLTERLPIPQPQSPSKRGNRKKGTGISWARTQPGNDAVSGQQSALVQKPSWLTSASGAKVTLGLGRMVSHGAFL